MHIDPKMKKGNLKSYEDIFFPIKTGTEVFSASHIKRFENPVENGSSCLMDIHARNGAKICFLQIPLGDTRKEVAFSCSGTIEEVLDSRESGRLLRVEKENRRYTVWIPTVSGQYRIDDHQRISETDRKPLSCQLQFHPQILLSLILSGNSGEVAIIPFVVFEDPDAEYFEELRTLDEIEQRLYRKTEWFFARSPSDIWKYLINGSVYDPRSHSGIGKRFKCQQCAYAWWSYFGYMHKNTRKKIYDVLQDEVAFSVLADMSDEGKWGHGFWSDEMETHTRFHLDGVHLLISQYKKTKDFLWRESGERGMSFVLNNLVDRFDDGSIWFLHDTVEGSQQHHFKSTIFGKSAQNSLCINTHLQALSVLHRLREIIPENKAYSAIIESGTNALRRVLEHRPGDNIHKILMLLMIKYKRKAPAKTIKGKLKNLVLQYVPDLHWFVRRKYARLVYPGGFIERDLTISFFSDIYHIINIKDLLTVYQLEPHPWLRSYIKEGVSFIRRFLDEIGTRNAIASSPFYIELIDVYYMYDKLIEPIPQEELFAIEQTIHRQTGGYSIDYYASELVRGESCH